MKMMFLGFILMGIGLFCYHYGLTNELTKKFEVPDGVNVITTNKRNKLELANWTGATFSYEDDPNHIHHPVKIIVIRTPEE